ncbi:ABC transporter substrate-binding protein [Symbiobacterium thermophilum]|uniref:ABC transporter substrate-binding protein n=1 Tax=Symbiobacterium thermophilum TaxID=2734 RepID=UPI002357455E|nr:ABC transporter substrate-binding protein [Symbiobacterium thermophilum]
MRHRRVLVVRAVALATALSVALAGCGRASRGPEGGEGASGTDSARQRPVVVLQGVDATTLDPAGHAETPAYNILNNIYDTLIYRNQDMKLEPGLATEWRTLNDTTWELKLREGVRFHNGDPFNAYDVKATIERIIDPEEASPRRNNLSAVQEVRVIDDYTVHIITSVPYPILPNRLANEHVISAEYLAEYGKEHLANNPMGTGPYRFVRWVKQEEVVLEANPDYWRGAPQIQQVIFRPVPEAATRISQIQTGQADIAVNIPANQVEALRNDSRVRIVEVPSVRVIYVAVQTRRGGILANPTFRRALAHAIDGEALIENVLMGNGYLMATALTPQHFGFNPDLQPYRYDPDLARQLLAEAGYQGEEIQFDTPSGRYAMDKEMAEAIAGQLAQVSVNVRIQVNEWGNHVDLMTSREQKGIYILGWGNATWDADGTLSPLLFGDGAFSSYESPEVDELILRARSTMDPAERERLYHEALRMIHEDAAHLIDWRQKDVYATSTRIHWLPRSDEEINLFSATWAG